MNNSDLFHDTHNIAKQHTNKNCQTVEKQLIYIYRKNFQKLQEESNGFDLVNINIEVEDQYFVPLYYQCGYFK